MQDGPDPSPGAAPSYGIKFLNGPREGESFPLDRERTTFGRRSDCTVVVPDSNASSVHAEIIFESGQPVIRDLGSTNGVFVGSRKIDEEVLAEGDTFLIGQTKIQLRRAAGGLDVQDQAVYPAAQDRPGAMDEVRVIHDIRPGKRGPGGIVLFVILFLAVLGSAYYYFFRVKDGGVIAAVTPDKANLVGREWSFEPPAKDDAAADVWDLEGDSPVRFNRTRGKARSGSWSLTAAMPEGGWAAARRIERVRVNPRPGSGYRASVWAAVQGEVVVGLKADFFGSPGPGAAGKSEPGGQAETILLATEDIAFGRTDDGSYHAVEGLVAPPQGCEEMELRIVAAGRGTARIDDLDVREESLPAADPLSQGAIELRPTGAGFAVSRNRRLLVSAGRIAVIRENAEGQPEVIPSEASGAGGGEACCYAGPGLGLLKVKSTLGEGPAGFRAAVTIDGAQAAGCRDILYCFDLTPEFAEAGVGLFTADDFVSFSEEFPPRPATSILFGGQHDRIRVTFEDETRVSAERGDGGRLVVRCHLECVPRIVKRLDIKCDFSADYQEAQALLKDAARAEADRRLGEALELISRIEVSYRFVESVFNEAGVIKNRILDEKRRLLADIQERLRSAVFLQNLQLFDSLEAFCSGCLELLPGDPELAAALDGVREQSRELRQAIDDERAETLYRVAANLAAAGDRGATLKLIREHMEAAYAESEWTAKVRELGRE